MESKMSYLKALDLHHKLNKEQFDLVWKAMDGYGDYREREALVKNNVDLDAVVGQSEQLKAFFEFLEFRDYLNCDATKADQIIKDHITSL